MHAPHTCAVSVQMFIWVFQEVQQWEKVQSVAQQASCATVHATHCAGAWLPPALSRLALLFIPKLVIAAGALAEAAAAGGRSLLSWPGLPSWAPAKLPNHKLVICGGARCGVVQPPATCPLLSPLATAAAVGGHSVFIFGECTLAHAAALAAPTVSDA